MKSESIAELAKALSKAQAEMQAATMRSENPYFKSKYADLGEIILSARQPLAKYGLAFVQPVSGDNYKITVTTILMHESGEYIGDSVTMTIPDDKGKAVQAAGSIITYLRRYSLASMLGIYADEDNDGNRGDGKATTTTGKPAARPPITAPAQVEPDPTIEAEKPQEVKDAEALLTTDGKTYGSLTTAQLSYRANSMSTKLQESGLNEDYRTETIKKLAATRLIIDWRASQS